MNIVLIVAGVLIMLLLAFLSTKSFNKQDKRKQYLESLAQFLESKLEPVAGEENSYQLRFVYKNIEFVFEDIEDRIQKVPIYKVYLKAQTSTKFKISFTERPRTTIIANVQTLSDLKTPWQVESDKVPSPPALQRFTVFTSDSKKANALFANNTVAEIFTHFKSMDAMGHPNMSLEVTNGTVVLAFHPPGELKPIWTDLQNNVSLIEDYLQQLEVIVRAIDKEEK